MKSSIKKFRCLASQGEANYPQGQAQPNKNIQEGEMHRAAMNKESMY